MYCIVDFREAADGSGREPDIPEGVSFLLLADKGRGSDWGLYWCETWLDDGWEFDWPVHRVPEHAADLIASGQRYPPALALARREIEEMASRKEMNKERFIEEYAARIEVHLSSQRNAPYLLAKSIGEQPGYRARGAYYWIIRYIPAAEGGGRVRWVSDDYFVYEDPASQFEIEQNDIERLTTLKG